MSLVKAAKSDAFVERVDVRDSDECEWAKIEKVPVAQIHVVGEFESVVLEGSLYAEDGVAVRLLEVRPAAPLVHVSPVPWKVRPVVIIGAHVTIRLYIPRG